jgi:hypothetical protein
VKPYILVLGKGYRELEKHVNEAITNGYVPSGGPFAMVRHERLDDWYCQAMVLPHLA